MRCFDSSENSFSVTLAALEVSLFWQQSICWGEDTSVLFVCCYQQGWDTSHSVLNGVSNAVALGFCNEWGERSIRGIRPDKLTDLHRKHRAWEAAGESELDLTFCWWSLIQEKTFGLQPKMLSTKIGPTFNIEQVWSKLLIGSTSVSVWHWLSKVRLHHSSVHWRRYSMRYLLTKNDFTFISFIRRLCW